MKTNAHLVNEKLGQMEILQTIAEALGEKDWQLFTLDKNKKLVSYNNRFASVNQALYGRKVQPGLVITECFPPDKTSAELQQNIDRAFNGENISRIYSQGNPPLLYKESLYPVITSAGEVGGVTVIVEELADPISERNCTLEQLKASEQKYRSLVDSTDAYIAMYSVDGELLFANNNAAHSLNLQPSEMIGKNIKDLFPPQISRSQLSGIEEVIRTGKPQVSESLTLISGEERWQRTSIQPVRDTRGNIFAALINAVDITPIKRAEADTRQYAYRLEGLHTLDKAILTARDTRQLAESALEHLFFGVVPCQVGRIFSIEPDGHTLSYLAFRSRTALEEIPDKSYHLGDYNLKRLVDEPYILLEGDFGIEFLKDSSLSTARKGATLLVGIREGEDLLGLILLFSSNPDLFSIEHTRIVVEVADVVAIGIHTARLNEQIHQYTGELQERVRQRTLELENSRIETRAILDNSADGILLVDQEQGVRQVNQAARIIFGLEENRILGQPLSSLIHPEDRERVESTFQEVISLGTNRRVEARTLRAGDNEVKVEMGIAPVQLPGQPGKALVCTIRDVTDHRRIEEALRQSEELYRLVVDNISEGLVLQGADGSIKTCNAAAERIMGMSLEEMKNHATGNITTRAMNKDGSPFNVESHPSHITFQTGEPQSGVVIGQFKLDGTMSWLSISTQPIFDRPGGTLTGVVSTITDITKRKRVEDALRESEKRFLVMADSAPNLIWVSDTNGLCTFFNKSWLNYTGRTLEQELGNGWILEVHPNDLEYCLELYKSSIKDRQSFLMEYRLRRFDGEYRWIENRGVPIFTQDGGFWGFIGSAIDITGRRAAEEALRQSESRYRLVAENITDMVVRVSLNGEFLYVSPSSQAVVGYTPEELIGRCGFDFLHPDDLPATRAAFGRVTFRNTPYTPKIARFLHKNGHYIWLETTGQTVFSEDNKKPVELVTTSRDVSARIEAENYLNYRIEFEKMITQTSTGFINLATEEIDEEINKALARLAVFMEVEKSFIFIYSPDGATVSMTHEWSAEGFLPLKDYSQNMPSRAGDWPDTYIKNLQVVAYNTLEDCPDEFREFRNLLARNGVKSIIFVPMVFERRAFGILGLESFKVQKQWHEDDIALLTIAGEIFSNALKRKEAQEEIQRMLEKERELNALKSSFVSTASHEFRTPLTTILSTAELLERYEGRWSIERREELFNRIRAAIKNMTSLLDDVLLVNKADAGRLEFKPTSFDFRALCLNLVEELKLGSGADHHFELDLTEGLFWGDEKLLRQIITNLLTNGIKYSSEGSTILFKLWYDSGDAILEIADQGIGIPEEALSHLFEVFYRAENVGDIKGTGLGLTIVKKCLDAHAAWIDIQSQVGKGTSCKLWIPLLKPN